MLEEENELIKKHFNLEDILNFQSNYGFEIIRGEDYQYLCYINKKYYGTSLTPMGALTFGIKQFLKSELSNEQINDLI